MTERLSFESVNPGDQLPVVTKYITQEDLWRYGARGFDAHLIHLDPDWCKQTKVLGLESTVVHGYLTMALLTTVVSSWAYPVGGEIKTFDAKLFKPVPPDSTLTFGGVVAEKHVIGDGRNFVVVELEAKDESGGKVATAVAEVGLP